MTLTVQATIIIGSLLMSIMLLVLFSTVAISSLLPTEAPPSLAAVAVFATTNGGITCEGETLNIVGTNGNDDIVGTSGNDIIAALGGNDRIRAQGGNDLICGNGGNDSMSGGDGNDFLAGNQGIDDGDGGFGEEFTDVCVTLERHSNCERFS
jgi:Ca2+-binding RTX toxin-like protein